MRASDRDIETETETERETERQRGGDRKKERERERKKERGTKIRKDSATAKRGFSKVTNLTVLCFNLDKTVSRRGSISPKRLLMNRAMKCIHCYRQYKEISWQKNYLFRLFDLHLHENFELEEKTLKLFNRFITTVKECKLFFSKCSINDPPIADDLLHLKSLLIRNDCVDVNYIGRVVLQSVQRPSKTVRVLRNNVFFCHLANNISVFGVLPCASFWHFLNGAYFLERRITMCSEQVGNVFFATSMKPRRSLWRNWPFWNWRRERSDAVQKRCHHSKEYSFHLNSYIRKTVASSGNAYSTRPFFWRRMSSLQG